VFDGYDIDEKAFPKRKHDLHIFEIDSFVCERAAECITKEAPDLNWVYLWYTDDAYHLFGDGTFSDKYVHKTDSVIAKLWEAVKYREQNHNEEWMVIILTDHGRDEMGYGHGGQSDRARAIWMSTNIKEVNGQFAEPYLSHADVNPTICKFMGFEVPRDVAFESDGSSFYGPRDIYALESRNYDNKVVLSWKVDQGKGTARVFMASENNFAKGQPDDWKEVATVPVTDGGCTVDLGAVDSDFYKFAVQTENTVLNLWNPRKKNQPYKPAE
ncbi:MAG: alkaline phosphatase family protein, partial [Bacteroidaceae bacterium]|nr:alkaline phosphatase family protein [Bacteroidaceae bacterium]